VMHLDHIYYDHDLILDHVALHRTKKSLIASDHVPLYGDFILRAEAAAEAKDGTDSKLDRDAGTCGSAPSYSG